MTHAELMDEIKAGLEIISGEFISELNDYTKSHGVELKGYLGEPYTTIEAQRSIAAHLLDLIAESEVSHVD